MNHSKLIFNFQSTTPMGQGAHQNPMLREAHIYEERFRIKQPFSMESNM